MNNILLLAERFEEETDRIMSPISMKRRDMMFSVLHKIEEKSQIIRKQLFKINLDGTEYITLDDDRFGQIMNSLDTAVNNLSKVSVDIPDMYDEEEL